MTDTDLDQRVADAARIIDQHAFGNNPNDTMIRRQKIARRKASDILAPPCAMITELVGELAVAHKQIAEMLTVSTTLSANFQSELGPGIARRADLLARHGRTPDD